MWQSKEHLIVSMTGIAKAPHTSVFSSALHDRVHGDTLWSAASKRKQWRVPPDCSPGFIFDRQQCHLLLFLGRLRGISARGREEEGDQKQEMQEESRQKQSSSAGLRSSWLGRCLTRQGMVSMPRMKRTAASTHTVWPGSREVTLTDCSKCQGSRRREGNWTWVKEHGSLQREKKSWAVATELVYNLCFLVCEWQEGRRCLRQEAPACTQNIWFSKLASLLPKIP